MIGLLDQYNPSPSKMNCLKKRTIMVLRFFLKIKVKSCRECVGVWFQIMVSPLYGSGSIKNGIQNNKPFIVTV